jgi:hypothetical protein
MQSNVSDSALRSSLKALPFKPGKTNGSQSALPTNPTGTLKTGLENRAPLWKGPYVDGITFSMLSRFLVCRERFRLYAIEGLQEEEKFNAPMEYGSLWHAGEEAMAKGQTVKKAVYDYADKLRDMYPTADGDINKWAALCIGQLPIYKEFAAIRARHAKRVYFAAEKGFKIPYTLPSGITLFLRGKIDGGFTEKRENLIQENKTKGSIDEEGISKTIDTNLQAMIYFVAAQHLKRMPPLHGIYYNVIRRPLSDRYAIRQKKKETTAQFIAREISRIKANPKGYFYAWKCRITPNKVTKFKREILHPWLEQLCQWWNSIQGNPFEPWHIYQTINGLTVPNPINLGPNPFHYRMPFGVYSSLAGGFRGDFFDYLTTGRQSGLAKVRSLFSELEE